MRRRAGIKALGLCALVMGVMAIGNAGAAQAETGACWGYESGGLKCFSSLLEATPLFKLENSTGTLLFEGINLEILCTAIGFIEGGQLAANGSVLLGRLQLSGCISLSKTPTLTKLNSCTPKDPVSGLGTIRTEKGTGLIVLKEGQPALELKPDTGTTLIKLFLGEECSIGEELKAEGKVFFQDVGGKATFEEHKLVHLWKVVSGLKAGGTNVTIDGTVEVSLAVPHNALKWAGKAA